MSNTNEKHGTMEWLKNNWWFVLAFVTFAFWAARLQASADFSNARIIALEVEKMNDRRQQEAILLELTNLKSDTKWIREVLRTYYRVKVAENE